MFKDYEVALKEAQVAIDELKEIAERIRDNMQDVIDACETLEDEI